MFSSSSSPSSSPSSSHLSLVHPSSHPSHSDGGNPQGIHQNSLPRQSSSSSSSPSVAQPLLTYRCLTIRVPVHSTRPSFRVIFSVPSTSSCLSSQNPFSPIVLQIRTFFSSIRKILLLGACVCVLSHLSVLDLWAQSLLSSLVLLTSSHSPTHVKIICFRFFLLPLSRTLPKGTILLNRILSSFSSDFWLGSLRLIDRSID